MRYVNALFIILWLSSCGGSGGGGNSENGNSTGQNNCNDTKKSEISSKHTKDEWLIDTNFLRDGGPGKDGIPSIDSPCYVSAQNATFISDSDMIIGTRINDISRAYSHSILNWHEIVNLKTGSDFHTLSYCPLTGTAALWTVPESFSNKTFGVSGLLYNSNLILYDRETDSNWPQMNAQSANGSLIGNLAEENVVIETTWETWKQMYPETDILSNDTGYSRNYSSYPYGSYLTDSNLLFQVAYSDNRLHPKTRVLGVNMNGVNEVYEIDSFEQGVEVINEGSESSPYVVIGSSEHNFAVAYSSILSDGAELSFSAIDSSLPVIMLDNEGNQWDIFGNAVSGPRSGQKLNLESDFIAFWFAWVAFHPNPEIHNFN